jgi:dehydrogenase/reductase SDR family protein 4
MNEQIKNFKISLITGSTHGIGLSIAEKLGERGDLVIITSRKEENSLKAEEILQLKNISYDYYMCNFDVREQRLKLFEYINNKYGKLDTLVCTIAANPYIGNSLSITEKEFDKIVNTNIKNTFFTVIDFLELLKKGENSNILLISSYFGYVPIPYLGIFSISKTALFLMTKILSKELSKFNIRVNCLAPGFVQTRMASNIFHIYTDKIFLKRNSLPHEIAGIAQYLCSEESSFITGETVCVNGGMVGRL